MSENRKKKFLVNKDRDTAPRRPVLLKSDRDSSKETKREEQKEKVEKEKQPTILIKHRETSIAKEHDARAQSPKKSSSKESEIETQIIQPSKIVQNENKEKKGESRMKIPVPIMSESMKLIDENSDFISSTGEFLQDNNTNFLVVGIIGAQGVGKSTILNILSHNHKMEDICNKILFSHELYENPYVNETEQMDQADKASYGYLENLQNPDVKTDLWRKFKVQNIEQIERGQHCSNGVDIYVTSDRVILLDSQPITSASLMDDWITREGLRTVAAVDRAVHLESLQIASFLLTVCHVVIVVQDWFSDYNLTRFIQSAEMLKPTLSASNVQSPSTGPSSAQSSNLISSSQEGSESNFYGEHYPHLLLVQNKCMLEDYTPSNVKTMQDFYRTAFKNSKLQLNSGMFLYSKSSKSNGFDAVCHNYKVENCGDPINLFLLPEVYEDYENKEIYRGHPPFEELASRLRWTVFGATKPQLTSVPNLSEKNWLHYCGRAWDTIKKSTFFMEYGRLLP